MHLKALRLSLRPSRRAMQTALPSNLRCIRTGVDRLCALQEQSLTHVKERVALKAILDDKVRALIADIGQSVAELPIEVRCTASALDLFGAHAHLPAELPAP